MTDTPLKVAPIEGMLAMVKDTLLDSLDALRALPLTEAEKEQRLLRFMDKLQRSKLIDGFQVWRAGLSEASYALGAIVGTEMVVAGVPSLVSLKALGADDSVSYIPRIGRAPSTGNLLRSSPQGDPGSSDAERSSMSPTDEGRNLSLVTAETSDGRRMVELWSSSDVSAAWDNVTSAELSVHLQPYTVKNSMPLHAPTSEQIESLLKLKQDMPNFAEVIDFIYEQMVLATCADPANFRFPPILLYGEPGVGKTRFAKAVTRVLGFAKLEVIPCGMENASFALGGMDSGWRNAKPGIPVTMLRSGACANPVVLLDEIDKFSAGKSESGGDAYAALYQLLEPENSKAFTDRYLLFPIDCSYINWILTANEVTEIPDPIRKRVRQFTIRRPTGQEMVDLVIPSVYREVIKDGNLCDAVDHSLSSVVMEVLAKLHTPREVRQALAESLGKAALRNRSTGDTGALLTLAVEDFAKIPSKERQRIGF